MPLADNNGMRECSPRTAGRPAGCMRDQARANGRGGMGGSPHVAKRFCVGAILAHKVTRSACMLLVYAHKVMRLVLSLSSFRCMVARLRETRPSLAACWQQGGSVATAYIYL